MSILLTFLLALSQKQFSDRPVILDGASDKYASEYLFIATPEGVYVFNRTSTLWNRMTQATGLPDNRVEILGLDDGILWAATPKGLASADVRIHDWQTYDLPGPVKGLDFDRQYVWAGGDFGLRRFDKFTETWEAVSETRTSALCADQDFVWVATDSGVRRYNRDYDRLEEVPAPNQAYSHIIRTPRRVWFLAPDRFASLRLSDAKWSEYPGFQVHGLSALGDSLFVTDDSGVRLYEPGSDNWVPVREVENVPRPQAVFAANQSLYLATGSGLAVYGWADRNLKTWRREDGLEHDSLLAAYADKQFTYAVSREDIEFLDNATGIWKQERILPAARKREHLFSLDDDGAHFRPGLGMDLKLSGRANLAYSRSWSDAGSILTTDTNVALNLTAARRTGRSLGLFYDNTDKQEITYGLGYRGLDRDLLYRANAGYIKSEYANFDLIPRFSLLGGNARLRYKAQDLSLQAGRLQSSLRNDFFTGRNADRHVTLRDNQYSRRSFYYVSDAPRSISPTWDTVFVDDRDTLTNDIATRRGATIGGWTGDFDPLVNGLDYYLDYDRGIIQFLTPRKTTDVVMLVLDERSLVMEITIQSPTVPGRTLENVYVAGRKIVPGTFELVITDTTGNVHPLSEFGLIPNHQTPDTSRQPDPEFINYDLGLLTFPLSRPFPDTVYLGGPSAYTLDIRYRTQSEFYQLSYHPIEKNSEQVLVDGDALNQGADYVLDYSNGILLFLRPDIVSDFSEVSVQYASVERDQKTMFYAAQPVLRFGSGLEIAPGYSQVGNEKLVHLSGRAETRSGSLRFIPQVAFTTRRALAQDYSLLANYRILSVRGKYLGYTGSFPDFGAAERKYGNLRHSASLDAGIEPVKLLRLDGQFQREYLSADSAQAMTQNASARLSYANPRYPNGYLLIGRDDLPDHDQQRAKAGAGYDFELARTKLKLNATVQQSRSTPTPDGSTRPASAFEYIIEAGFNLPVPVHGNVYFQRNDLSGDAARREQEFRIRLNFDLIPGVFYTGSYKQEATNSLVAQSRDLLLSGLFYNDLHIAPGRWWPRLSIVNLAFGTGDNFEEYARNLSADYQAPLFALSPVSGIPVSHAKNLNSLYGSVQLDPFSNLMLRLKRNLNRSGRASYTLPALSPATEDEVRVEYQPRSWGSLNAFWNRQAISSFPAETIHNTYLEWNRPWTNILGTKLTAGYRTDRNDYGTAFTTSSELKGNLSTIARTNSRSFAAVNMGASRQTPASGPAVWSLIPGAGLNVNLFRFLYIRIDEQSTFPLGASAAHQVSAKVTGQF